MSIRFPRRIDRHLRPAYGLTIRQMVLLGAFGLAGGLVVLAGEGLRLSLTVRLVVALALVGLGGGLAFMRIEGQPIERWVLLKVRFFSAAHRRVWKKGEGRPIGFPEEAQPQPRPARAVSLAAPREIGVVILAIEVVLVFALSLLTLYLWRGGLADVQAWLRYVFE